MSSTEVISGRGTVEHLAGLVAAFEPRRVLVAGGHTAIGRAEVVRRLDRWEVHYFTEFTPNPQLRDVLRGCALVEAYRPDVIVGVGGGSAMDVAKMIRLL